MTKDTIYWIFSTLPQVLAALAGLIMAGLAIYDQNLKREIDRDSSLEARFSLSGLSLEEEKSFQDALDKIRDED
ncbi:MAG: hypothetical protein K2H15_01060 [Muribaculaceae bacterium]|nr:hypothetical protein [Muribaculaceae bacterium]